MSPLVFIKVQSLHFSNKNKMYILKNIHFQCTFENVISFCLNDIKSTLTCNVWFWAFKLLLREMCVTHNCKALTLS